jgi:YfiH family protein
VAPNDLREVVDDFAEFGIRAFTTTRRAGTYGMNGPESVADVMGRWYALVDEFHPIAPRFATARQVHGARIATHRSAWDGWLRVPEADGHLALDRGTAFAVTIADCVPIFVAHPSGVTALLHSGWRGTVAGILETCLRQLTAHGLSPGELRVHLGPSICGRCYEVSADVYQQLTGQTVARPTTVDLRGVIADRAARRGVSAITTSPSCTRCDNDRFFSHRAGDSGRQIGVMIAMV